MPLWLRPFARTFEVVLRSVLYAPDMRTSIAHGEGQVFVNMPVNERALGMNQAQPGSMFTRHQQSGQAATLMTGRVLATGDDRMIAMRENEKMNIGFTIQVDTLCHKIPNFIEKAAKSGVRRVFIGLENINPDNLIAANKRQNKITEYRHMMQMWHERGCFLIAGLTCLVVDDRDRSVRQAIDSIDPANDRCVADLDLE